MARAGSSNVERRPRTAEDGGSNPPWRSSALWTRLKQIIKVNAAYERGQRLTGLSTMLNTEAVTP